MTVNGELLVGAATAEITPAIGAPMGGYGARQGVAEGVGAPLRCHATVFDDGGTVVAMAVCDLVFVTRDLSGLSRRLIAETLGLPPENVVVAATHTHSGPAGLTLEQDPAYVTMVARQIAGAVRLAFERRAPARLLYNEAAVSSISQNRRHPDGPIETVSRILVATEEIAGKPDGKVLATIVSYACHATVLEYDNLLYSPDFPGAVVDVLCGIVGGEAIYLQGCAGDINPVWMRHDHEEARRIGAILGAAAARSVNEVLPLGHGQWAVNLSWLEDTGKEVTAGREVAARPLRTRSELVALPQRAQSSTWQLEEELRKVLARLDQPGVGVDERRELSPSRAALEAALFFARHPDNYHVPDGADRTVQGNVELVEVQVLRFDDQTAIVALPGEPFIEIADEIRRRSGLSNLIVAGYCNEAVGYLPIASEFPRDGYEVGCARYQPEAAARIVEAALQALAATA